MDNNVDYTTAYITIAFIFIFVFCIGTIIGSFLNVVILRAFSGESIVMPPSKCPKCKNKLKWWHNIPILSYILLHGKCYFCKEKISLQYPVIEFITGVLFIIVFCRYGITIDTIFAFAITAILIVLAVTDIKEKIVFDGHTYFLIAIGLIYNTYLTGMEIYNQVNTIVGFPSSPAWFASNPLTNSILGLILGIIIMEVAARIGYLIAGDRAFGEGDTYIAAGLGAVFGWQNIILIILLSIVIQCVITCPLFFIKQWKQKKYITVSTISLFILYVGLYYFIDFKTDIFNNFILQIFAFIILIILGAASCFYTLKDIKDKDSLTFLPFGPALALSGVIILVANFSLTLF